LHIEIIEVKAFTTFIRLYSILESERLSTNIKLTIHEAPIRSVITYACPTCEFAADTHLLKLKRRKTRFPAPLDIFLGAHRSAI
jgi:hypothetical protein